MLMTAGILMNKIFTVNSLKKLIDDKNIKVYKEAVKATSVDSDNKTNSEILQELYKYMSRNHRNEFFFKNTIINKILLGRHSLNTSTAIRELPIDNNILDLVVINGVGQVYEIKTGLDNLTRLNEQLDSYYRVFSYCNVVTEQSHVDQLKIKLKDTPTGLIVLNKRGSLHVERKAVEYKDNLNKKSMFDVLRKYEFEEIIQQNFGKLPNVPQSKYYDECFNIFNELETTHAQKCVLNQLKKRTNINKDNLRYFKMVPNEIKSLVYFSKYNEKDFVQLENFLNSKY